jgi:diguanylate cyclase (GGDEF)-like protein/putative nucleotidyltransferase with HDIG domain
LNHAALNLNVGTGQAVLDRVRALLRTDPTAAVQALEDAGALDTWTPGLQAEAHILWAQGLLALEEGEAAAEHARRAGALCVEAGDVAGQVTALLHQAEAEALCEHYDRVSELAQQVKHLLPEQRSASLAQAFNLQGMALFLQGQYREASAVILEEAGVREALQDHAGYAKCLNNLGLIHIELGDLHQALEHLARCFDYITHCPEPLHSLESACLINIGNIHQIRHEYEQAAGAFEQGMAAARRAGHTANEIAGLTGLGLIARDRGQHREALRQLLQALRLAQASGRRYNEAEILDNLGQVYADLGQRGLALETFGQALTLSRELGALSSEQNSLIHLARLHAEHGLIEQAAVHYAQALECARQSGSDRAALEIHEHLGRVLQRLERFEQAAVHFSEALSLERTLQNQERQDTFQNLTTQLEVERAKHQAETYRLMNVTSQRARDEAEQEVQKRTADLEQAQREIITRLGLVGEYRDDKTGSHTQRVSQLAASLAQAIGLPPTEVELIRLAARLHDIGKIGVPDVILLKTDKLSDEEFKIMKHHTTIGARVLEGGQSDLMRMAEEIALTHHERWDGSGYPQGLQGDHIPLTGRIVAIVDVWDALTTERSYKTAWTREEAWREMAAQSGKHFDPYLIEVFLGMIAGSFHAEPPVPGPDGTQNAAPSGAQLPAQPPLDMRPAPTLPAHVVQHVGSLNAAAWQRRRTDPARSLQEAREAHQISEQHDHHLGLAHALRTLGFHDIALSDFKSALNKLDQAVATAQACEDLALERDCKNMLGNVYRSIFNTERAIECLLEAMELSRQLGDLAGEANALMNLGVVASSRMKDRNKALSYYQQAYAVFEKAGNKPAQGACLYSIADAYQELGQFAQAQACGEQAAQVSAQGGDALHHALSISVIARALDAQGEPVRAAALHQQALTLLQPPHQDLPEPLAWIRLYSAANLELGGALQEACRLYAQVLADTEEFGWKELAMLAHHKLTLLYKRCGDMERAMFHLEGEREVQRNLLEEEMALKNRALMVQYEVDRAEAEARLYKVRSVELASANVALEQANREKSALVAALQEQSLLLERQLREDRLCGVFNRHHIEEILEREFGRHRSEGSVLSLIMLDVDHFKRVNDQFSHPVGDEVLRRLGALLLSLCRPADAPGRYGGEEFVLVLPGTALSEAVAVAQRLRGEVEHADWQAVAPGLSVTLSLGVATSEGLPDFERLVARADAKLYEAKRKRNCVAY